MGRIKWESLKSALFGKFYEELLEYYLKDEGYRSLSPKSVYWEGDVLTPLRESEYSFLEARTRVDGLGISPSAVSLLDSLKSSIETLGENPLQP